MQKYAQAYVTISIEAQKSILADVYQRSHIEACGVLLGTVDEQDNWYVEQALPLRNIFNSPVYFEFAPEELLAAELEHPGQIVGVYHSHPGGPARASSTDRQNMRRVNQDQQIPWVWCIISGPFTSTQEHIPGPAMIAYYHYAQEGLRRIPIRLEQSISISAHE